MTTQHNEAMAMAQRLAKANELLESADWAQARFSDDGLCALGAINALYNRPVKRPGWRLSRAGLIGDRAHLQIIVWLPRHSPDKQVSVTIGRHEFALTKGWGYMPND